MNDATTLTRDSQIEAAEDKLMRGICTASALFDLLATIGNDNSADSLMQPTLCSASIAGIDAVKDTENAFNELQKLYREAVKAQEAQS